jgi:uncharacterized RDD family membrane protein YckC
MTQPSGWYDDPQDPNSLRYFDGVLWTDNVVPRTSPTVADSTIGRAFDPYAAPAYPTAPPAGPWAGPSGPGAWADPSAPSAGAGPGPYGAPPPGYGYGAAPRLGWRTGPATPDGAPLAEWWQRLLANLLDGFISGAIALLATIYWWLPFVRSYVDLIRSVVDHPQSALDARAMDAFTNQVLAAIVPMTLVQLLVVVSYQVIFLTRSGATPGKAALGIRVRRSGRAGPLTLGEALRREALRIGLGLLGLVPLISLVSSLVGLLDPMWLLWDPRRQTLHDKIADTLVEVKPKPLR